MRVDKTLFFAVSILIAIGICFSLSLSVFTTLMFDYAPLHFFIRQLGVGLISIAIMWYLSRLNPDRWLHFFGMFLFISMFIVMLLMPVLPSNLVDKVNGASRWIRLPFISIAPVEFFKIGFI